MSNRHTPPVNKSDLPERIQLRDSRLQEADRRGIMQRAARFTAAKRDGHLRKIYDVRVGAAITNISDLETPIAAVAQQPDPVGGG